MHMLRSFMKLVQAISFAVPDRLRALQQSVLTQYSRTDRLLDSVEGVPRPW